MFTTNLNGERTQERYGERVFSRLFDRSDTLTMRLEGKDLRQYASVKEDVLSALGALGVSYELLEHAPVHTMEDCKAAEEALGGVMPKNLFLTPRNMPRTICLSPARTRPSAQRRISRQLGVSRLSFATAEELMEMLARCRGRSAPWAFCSTRRERCAWPSTARCGARSGFCSIPA